MSQMTSCGEGLRSLEKTSFVEHRLAEAWKVLEGGGTEDTASGEDGEDVESNLEDALVGGRSADGGALPVGDLSETGLQKVR